MQISFLFAVVLILCSGDFSTSLLNLNNVDDDGIVGLDILDPPHTYPQDLGGLEVAEASYFKKIWEEQRDGVAVYEPTFLPDGFSLLGHYGTARSMDLLEFSVIVARDITGDPLNGALKPPVDYDLIWSTEESQLEENAYIWLPIPPDGYKSVGQIITISPEKPSLSKIRCVRNDFTDLSEVDKLLWTSAVQSSSSIVSFYRTKPKTKDRSVPTGMLLARSGSSTHELACLKMVKADPNSAMPNPLQLRTLINAYSPWIYLHPLEQYFPASDLWFFENGAKLYQTGQEPEPVINDGANLPKHGEADDSFLDFPLDPSVRERLKRGSLDDAVCYIHVKSALGGTHTDLVVWIYYPYNGGGRFKLGPFIIDLGKFGEHGGDWEHITLRIDNFQGILRGVYLSQHAKGKWLSPREFKLFNGTRPVVYSALHSHAHYSAPKDFVVHLLGNLDPNEIQMLYDEFQMTNRSDMRRFKWDLVFEYGVMDAVSESENVLDVASTYNVISVDHMDFHMEPWLNFTGRWGPKITYDFTTEVLNIAKTLPKAVEKLVIKVLNKLPAELRGEEGPQGPKMKESWKAEERV